MLMVHLWLYILENGCYTYTYVAGKSMMNFGEDRELIAPVTALEFDPTGNIYVGEGPNLKIYESICQRLVCEERILENQQIHTIKFYESTDSKFGNVVVCGGRTVSVVNVQNTESGCKIDALGEILFGDWIWDTCLLQKKTEESDDFQSVAAATGHNAVWIWNLKQNTKFQVSQCEEQCILYCARFIGRTLDHMWLACGTVFNKVLLWKVTDKVNSPEGKVLVKKRLAGHDGVIFSVRYNEDRHLLCSVSDDRSIKAWKAVFTDNYSDVIVSTEPLFTLYGHKARVWDCLILKQNIVSVGEDSMCLLWNSGGEIIRSWKGHVGKSIWSLACSSNENFIATGGGDSAIRLWPVESEAETKGEEQHFCSSIPTSQQEITSSKCEEVPRMVGILHDTSIIVITDKGNLYRFLWCENKSDDSVRWNLIRQEPEYSSYSIMALSDCRTIVALVNISGSVKLISLADPSWCSLEKKPYTDKVLSLHWLKGKNNTSFNLFSCGPEGMVIWWTVQSLKTSRTFTCEFKATFRLPYSRQRWPNSIYLLSDDNLSAEQSLVLCGDRRGSLHVFKATSENEPVDPMQSLIGIHGRNGVTSISSNSGFIYTTGRDGFIRQYKLSGEKLEALDKKKAYKGMDWIDRIYFAPGGDVVVLGFHTVDFIIWSMTRNEVLFSITCGGGHRNWDILYSTVEHGLVFTYLKQSTIHVHTWSETKNQSSSIVQDFLTEGPSTKRDFTMTCAEMKINEKSFHGREANCVRFLETFETEERENECHLLATGSEDTTINIMIYNTSKTSKPRIRKVLSCEGHISSVRCLAFVKINHPYHEPRSQKYLLFSGGSRASLKCWLLDVDSILKTEKTKSKCTELNASSLNSSCILFAELRNQPRESRKKKQRGRSNEEDEFTCDIRFMSLSAFPLTRLSISTPNKFDTSCAVGVVTGCSDGYIRFYVFDHQLKTFALVGQGSFNERCVLCVGHIIYPITTQPRLIVYASDTAGYISFWNVTQIYNKHLSRQRRDVVIGNTSVLTENSISSVNNSSDYDTDKGGTDVENHFQSPEYSMDDVIRPFYSDKLHQSGVNAISLITQGKNQYLLCSGGDDGAVTCASFEIQEVDGEVDIYRWSVVSVPDAHTSATTGIKLLDDKMAVSASVDQRIKLWKINWNDQLTKLSGITLINNFWLDVVDVQDIDARRDRNGLYYIAASGVGLQILPVKCVTS